MNLLVIGCTWSFWVLLRCGVNNVEKCPFRSDPVIKYCGGPLPPDFISCPTCGRTHLRDPKTNNPDPFLRFAARVQNAVNRLGRPVTVAVMGCEVNGPGEAKSADIGIAMGVGKAVIFKKVKILKTVPMEQAFDIFM